MWRILYFFYFNFWFCPKIDIGKVEGIDGFIAAGKTADKDDGFIADKDDGFIAAGKDDGFIAADKDD